MKAALIGVDLDTGEHNIDLFDGDNPIEQAWRLKNAIAHDFPTRVWTVVGDAEAQAVHAKQVVKTLYGVDLDDEMINHKKRPVGRELR